VLIALALFLFLGACSSSGTSPEEVVDSYLSETGQEGTEAALQLWELSEVGTEFFALDQEQQKIRMDGRRALAIELTEALGIPGPRIAWEQEGAAYYTTRDGVPRSIDGPGEADLATIEMRIMIEGRSNAALEERLAFNLWRNPEKGWRITGLDKGLSVLRPLLEEIKTFR
jgi:hypothetical protein